MEFWLLACDQAHHPNTDRNVLFVWFSSDVDVFCAIIVGPTRP